MRPYFELPLHAYLLKNDKKKKYLICGIAQGNIQDIGGGIN